MMNYAGLRAEQTRLRERGIYRGIGFASFVEVTNPSAAFYGVGGARISSQDGATVRLDSTGAVFCHSGVTEQGQGAEAVMAQCVASAFGVPIERVRIVLGDTDNTPYGGGTWASRAGGIGGEAAWQAGKALRMNVLVVAGSILQAKPEMLDIRNGVVVDADSGTERLPLEELARVAYFRPDTLPAGVQAELVATRHYVPRAWPFAFTNGIQASYLEIDVRTGGVTLLKHWCVEDCGTVINPQLVDEQIRGGVVQGIGAALFEHCLYDARGQLLNGNMADYLVPMAIEMPDIEVGHVVTPTADLGARRQGRGRSRHRRRPGRGDECHQRCAAPARRDAAYRHAVHAGEDFAGAGKGVSQSTNPSIRPQTITDSHTPIDSAPAVRRRTGGMRSVAGCEASHCFARRSSSALATPQRIKASFTWNSGVAAYCTARMENNSAPATIASVRPVIATGTRMRASALIDTDGQHPISRRSSGTMAPNRSAMPTIWLALTAA